MMPTRDEVVEHFITAKVVRCLCYGLETNISINIKRNIYRYNGSYWIDIKGHTGTAVKLWDETKGYAMILTQREDRMFGVGEKLMLQIYNGSNKRTKKLIKTHFPKLI